MKRLSADSLIQIGKPATEKLIAILDDTSKGIIAHYILTSIWYDTLQKNSLLDYTPVWNSEDEGKGISNFENGLKFYYNDEFGIYTERKELERNKHKWQKFIYTINLKQSIHY